MSRLVSAAVVLVAVLAGSASGGSVRSAAPGWNVRDLGTLGGRWSRAVDVNDRGDVVWESGRIQDLGHGGPTAISDRGWIVDSRNGHAALWTPIGS